MTWNFNFLILPFALVLMSCHSNPEMDRALENLTIDHLKKNISILASDDFLGRAPATLGEEKTITFLADQFHALGLIPANGESYFQEVPLLKITPNTDFTLKFLGNKGQMEFTFLDDYIGFTPLPNDLIDLENSEVVFVGYGIVAPEYQWNDYQGIDVQGKTVVMLVNDPGFATGDTALFTGKAMTYYGRWTYKFEEAVRQGAKAALVIHETQAAAYPWSVVENSFTGPAYYLEKNDFTGSDLQFTGWMSTDAAHKLFSFAGLNYEELITSACKRWFKSVNLNLKASMHFTNKIEHTTSSNAAALLPGSGLKDELIIFCAHWDHFGVNPSMGVDSILNGAVDNALGVATLLEIASGFKKLKGGPNRSILFLVVTAEEFGLLGSEYYAANPIYPLAKTMCVINLDKFLNIYGKTRDMTIIGLRNSEMEDYAIAVLKRNGRVASLDPTPEMGNYYRSDHFSFAKKGVPSLYLVSGVDNMEHGKEWGIQQAENWNLEKYHRTSDHYEPSIWDFGGIIDDAKVYFEIGYKLSMTDKFPAWKSKTPFKAMRDQMMN